MANVNMYQYPQVVTVSKPGVVSSATVINSTEFSAFKHVDNDVEFLIKDWDNKPVNLANTTVTIYVVEQSSQKLMKLAQPELDVVNPSKGHCRMTLSKMDTQQWAPGYYSYSITMTDINGKETPLFVDRSRVIQGYFEFFEGPLPQYDSSIVLTPDSFNAQSWGDNLVWSTYKVAEYYPGAAQSDNRSGLQTIAVYMNSFSGSLRVEASLENSPPTDKSQWFDVQLNNGSNRAEFTNYTGLQAFTFTGKYMWLRFIQHIHQMNEGSITKVLLKI